MNRRSFFKFLGAGAAGCAVAGVAKAKPKVVHTWPPIPKMTYRERKAENFGPTAKNYRSSIKVSIISDEQLEVLKRLYNQSDFELWEKYGNTRRT